jgi:two-component system, OmpR family, response regulator
MKKVLVVDDDQNILEAVTFILKSYGFEVHTHSTGLNVVDVVLDCQPDLILLDIRLPGKLGTEICKELKDLHCTIPIILFSAHAQQPNFLDSFGADAFMKKPFDVKDLINTVKLHMN